MNFAKNILLVFVCVSLLLSVIFSIKSFTGYLISDIADGAGNLKSFILLVMGLFGTFVYIKTFKNR